MSEIEKGPRPRRWIDRVLRREDISGRGICPVYLYRWTLLKLWGGIGLYLHNFVGDDWSLDMHDHPKRFVSLGIWGRYREHTPDGSRLYVAPWLRTFPAKHIHRLQLINRRPCWTVVLVLRASRQWGFWGDNGWVPWRRYVDSSEAVNRRSCP